MIIQNLHVNVRLNVDRVNRISLRCWNRETFGRMYSDRTNTKISLRLKGQSQKTTMYYLAALGVLVVGASYAAVPLYRIFCQSYSYGGTISVHPKDKDLTSFRARTDRFITVKFNADKSSSLRWNFHPRQSEIIVHPGETALAFYRAQNSTDRPVDGISTYNVIPFEAGQYFNKIQCFCFEEQRLNPGEAVELPVFFYIDPEFSQDPKMESVDTILLSYTFFESKEMPSFMNTLQTK